MANAIAARSLMSQLTCLIHVYTILQ